MALSNVNVSVLMGARRRSLLLSTAISGGIVALASTMTAMPVWAQCVTGGNQTVCNPLNANTTVNAAAANVSTTISVLSATPGFLLTASGSAAASTGSVGITVASGVNMVSAAGQNGLVADAQHDDLVVTAIGTVTGTGGAGLALSQSIAAANGTITVVANNTLTGLVGSGVQIINAGTGAVSVSGPGSITGTGPGSGILVSNTNAGSTADTDIRATGVIAAGAGGGIVVLNAGTGNVTIGASGTATGAITATGGGGIVASTTGAGIVSVVTGGAVDGGTGNGITVTNQTGAASVIAGANVTGGAGTNGIQVTSNGRIDVINQGATTGGANGVVTNNTIGNTAIINQGVIIGTTGMGLSAAATTGNVDVTNNASRSITGQTSGVTIGTTAGIASLLNNGSITGTTAAGVSLTTTGGNAAVVNNATITGATFGANLVTAAGGRIDAVNSGVIQATGGVGLSTTAVDGFTQIDNNTGGLISGTTFGIEADTTGTGSTNIVNNATITASNGGGIFSTTTTGSNTITNTLNITGSVGGVQADATTGAVTIVNNGGTIRGTTNFGAATNTTTGNVSISNLGGGLIEGGAVGVRAISSGRVDVLNQGTVRGGANGVFITNNGALATGVINDGMIVGTTGTGVLIAAQGGAATVTNNAGRTITGGEGVNVSTTGGAATVVSNGIVTGTATDGITTTSAGGPGVIVNAGSVNAVRFGIQAFSTAGNSSITNLAGATVQAGQIGIVTSANGGTATVNNAGSIVAPVIYHNASGIGIFNNAGTLTGGFTSAAAATSSTINNNATWNFAGGTFANAGANDVFNNNNIVNTTGATTFTGVETVNNAGGANINVGAGSSLLFTGANVANAGMINIGTGGTFGAGTLNNNNVVTIGSGGTLSGNTTNNSLINANAGPATIQGNLVNNGGGTLNMVGGGNTTATVTGTYTGAGSVAVDLNLSTVGGARSSDQLVIGGGAGTVAVTAVFAPGAITVANGAEATLVTGLAGRTVNFNGVALASGQSVVVGTFGIGTTSVLNTGAQLVTTTSFGAAGNFTGGVSAVLSSLNSFAEPASAFVTGPANPDANKFSIGSWARVRAGEFNIKSTTSVAAFAPSRTSTRTEFRGIQAGVDAGIYNINNTGWNAILGLHAGQVTGVAGNGDSTVSLDQPFGGAYIVVKNNAFTFDAMIRRDIIDMKVSSVSGGFTKQKLSAEGWSGLVSGQYRYAVTETVTVTPSMAFMYSKIDVGTLNANGTTATWKPIESMIGRAGIDISTIYQLSSQAFLVPFVNASIWHEFAGKVKSTLAGTLAGSTTRVGTYAQFSLGLALTSPTPGFTGFVRGDLRTGAKIDGYAINGGVRYQF